MDLITAIKTRRSLRAYKAQDIPKEDVEGIIDAARFAPTARAVEPLEFIAVTNKETLKKISDLAENGRFIAQAAACVVVFSGDTKYYLEDGCAATENILLAARARGIGSCWVAGDKKPYCLEIAKLLGVPVTYKLVSLISLGYPLSGDDFKIAQKKGLEEVLHWEKF